MTDQSIKVGEVWKVRMGVITGERKIMAITGGYVELRALTVYKSDLVPWAQVEFIEKVL